MARTEIDPLEYGGLVATIARDFRHHGIGLDDLIQEGHLATLKAVRRWAADQPGEPMPGAYAAKWIRGEIGKAVRRHHEESDPIETVPALDELAAPDDPEPDLSAVRSLLGLLTDRQAQVLTLRLGLDGHRPLSQEETGRRLGRCDSVVLKHERAALAKLRKALTDDPRPLT